MRDTAHGLRTGGVLFAVAVERYRQDELWGEQNHPDGTGDARDGTLASWVKEGNALRVQAGTLTWADILREEFYEAMAESDPAALRAELVQVAAVATAWVEAIDRRTS